MSHVMGKPHITAQLICAFVFATQIEQFLFFLNPKISGFQPSSVAAQASLCQTWSENPEDPFSRVAAQMLLRHFLSGKFESKPG